MKAAEGGLSRTGPLRGPRPPLPAPRLCPVQLCVARPGPWDARSAGCLPLGPAAAAGPPICPFSCSELFSSLPPDPRSAPRKGRTLISGVHGPQRLGPPLSTLPNRPGEAPRALSFSENERKTESRVTHIHPGARGCREERAGQLRPAAAPGPDAGLGCGRPLFPPCPRGSRWQARIHGLMQGVFARTSHSEDSWGGARLPASSTQHIWFQLGGAGRRGRGTNQSRPLSGASFC